MKKTIKQLAQEWQAKKGIKRVKKQLSAWEVFDNGIKAMIRKAIKGNMNFIYLHMPEEMEIVRLREQGFNPVKVDIVESELTYKIDW